MTDRSSDKFQQELPHSRSGLERMWYSETQKHYHNITQETLADVLSSLSFIRKLLFFLIGLEIGELLAKFV